MNDKKQQAIDNAYAELADMWQEWQDRALRARETARKARRTGDTKKGDKFNAVARVYEMNYLRLMDVTIGLVEHLSDDVISAEIPF